MTSDSLKSWVRLMTILSWKASHHLWMLSQINWVLKWFSGEKILKSFELIEEHSWTFLPFSILISGVAESFFMGEGPKGRRLYHFTWGIQIAKNCTNIDLDTKTHCHSQVNWGAKLNKMFQKVHFCGAFGYFLCYL